MTQRRVSTAYIVGDFIAGGFSWSIFYYFRKIYVEKNLLNIPVEYHLDPKLLLGIFFIAFGWITIYALSGMYNRTFRRTHSANIVNTFLNSLTGVTLLFFAFILDDFVQSYRNYYLYWSVLFFVHFTLTLSIRSGLTIWKNILLRTRKLNLPTLILGCNIEAVALSREIKKLDPVNGWQFAGYLKKADAEDHFAGKANCMGYLNQLTDVIKNNQIKNVVLSLPDLPEKELIFLLRDLFCLQVDVFAMPTMYAQLSNKGRLLAMVDKPLMQLQFDSVLPWQKNIKIVIDLLFSGISLIVCSPVMIVVAAIIKLTSKGPIIYKQERIGLYGKPFQLYKFRSMYTDAEKHGPSLTSKNDDRTTPIGKFIRRTKIDELPNFINVIKGDMSLVGPRPERQYFIDKIVELSPMYLMLQKVKPGITSIGQVKYGYAENVHQMVNRLKYDIIYVENRSIWFDFKILYYTALLVFKGRGV